MNYRFIGILAVLLLSLITGCFSESPSASDGSPLYSVAYDANGADSGDVPEDDNNYKQNQIVTVPGNSGNLVKDGYKFVGWNTLSDGNGDTYTSGQTFTMGTSDITLYAVWTVKIVYNITYDANAADSGDVPVDTTGYEQGAKVTIPGNTGLLVKEGYNFAGWNVQQDGNGANYTTGQSYTMGGANITLYARWTLKQAYSVIYDANGADGGEVPVDTMKYEKNTIFTILDNTGNLTKSGYCFAGWSITREGTGTSFNPGAKYIMGTADFTLYAKWVVGYSVTYVAAGATSGTVPVDHLLYPAGGQFKIPGNPGDLKKNDDVVGSWIYHPGLDDERFYEEGQTFYMKSANVTLYADWVPKTTDNVIYHGNWAEHGTVPVDTTEYNNGDTVTVRGNTGNLTRTNYVFAGWNTQSNGKGTNYNENQTFLMGTADVDLYATWIWIGPGSLDTTFNPGTGPNDYVRCILLQPDGKIIIAGDFTEYNGTVRNHIARLNSDGSLDTSFDPGTGTDDDIYSAALQADGKIIIVGFFTSYNGFIQSGIIRINSDGTPDESFDVGDDHNMVSRILIQPDGKIVVAGYFPGGGAIDKEDFARLNPDGTVDDTFDPGYAVEHTTSGNSVECMLLLSDNKILIAGDFNSYGGIGRDGIARINSDGSLDTTFEIGVLSRQSSGVYCIMPQDTDYIMFGGNFLKTIIRCGYDGQDDDSFMLEDSGVAFNGTIYSMRPQADGKIICTGVFSTYGDPWNSVIRLDSNGTPDAGFRPALELAGDVRCSVIQPDGKILIGGHFWVKQGSPQWGIARLNN